MTKSTNIACAALLAALATACNIDFDADVPCDSTDDCPSGYVCDLQFFRCVEGEDPDASDTDDVTDTQRDTVRDPVTDPVRDIPVDTPVDVPSDGSGADVPTDTPVDVPTDTPTDVPTDVPADGSGDAGCVPTGPEVCDGVDNDCNGTIDDPPVCDAGPCGAGMILIDRGDGSPFCIDTWEASRTDATADNPGADNATATSRPGVIPWSTVSFADASAACSAAGKRLCSAFEWQTACQGAALSLYPYGNSYQSSSCNGSNAPPLDGPAPTGSFTECLSSEGTYDQSGNLSEWTTDGILRGGAFADPQLNLRCSSRTSDPGGSPLPAFGFRCCKDGP